MPPPLAAAGSVRPGTLPGATAIQTPKASSATASARAIRSPGGSTFSASTISATTAIHRMLMTPTANRTSISAQQQPAHHAPCSAPIRSAPVGPGCQRASRKCSGLRQWRRQTRLSGLSW
jgi:hypothetical protein